MEDPLLPMQRTLRIAPRRGLGAPRRAPLYALVTWLPVAIWAVATGHAHFGQSETFMSHLGLHVRCLFAIPILILSEPFGNRVLGVIIDNFPASGLIRPED